MSVLSASPRKAATSNHQKQAIASQTMAQLLIQAHRHRQKIGCYQLLTHSASDASLLLTALAEFILLLVRPAHLNVSVQGHPRFLCTW